MDLTIETAMRQGIIAHKSGSVEEARTYYLAVLKKEPNHPDANHNLGVLSVSAKKIESSIPFFEAAVKSDPSREIFWENYIESLIFCGHFGVAKKALVRSNLGKDKKEILRKKRLALIFGVSTEG